MLFKVAIDASLGPVYMFCFYKTNKKVCKSDCLPKKLEKKKKSDLGGRNGKVERFIFLLL